MTRPQSARFVRAVSIAAVLALAATATAQTSPATAGPPAGLTLSVRDATRVEVWRYFEPTEGGGEPDYAYLANRLQLELRRAWPRVEVQVAAQHVAFAGLPTDATGPGPLGLGALYFEQGGRSRQPQQLWLRYANVRLKGVIPGLDLTVGRMAYASGAEAASGDARLEALKRQRLEARMVGEFEWSVYQRGYDGLRADWTRGPLKATGVAVRPTQGGFARVAGPTIDDVRVYGATLSVQPTTRLPAPRHRCSCCSTTTAAVSRSARTTLAVLPPPPTSPSPAMAAPSSGVIRWAQGSRTCSRGV